MTARHSPISRPVLVRVRGEKKWSVNIREGREYSLRRYCVHGVTPVVRGAASRASLQQSETIKIGVEDAYDIGVCAVAVAGDR